MERAGWAKTPWLRIALVAFVAMVWLNQSVGGKDWESLRDEVFAAPLSHPLLAARYPFVFLYRRSLDERYYFETAGAILGEPADAEVFRQMHGKMPAGFEKPLPPADSRWHAPYTEVPLEYPPLNLPFFIAPRCIVSTFAGYGYLFGGVMGLCLVLAVFLGVDVARQAGASLEERREKWLLAAGLLLAQGALSIQRLDPIAALFLALALHAAARRRPFTLGVAAGLAGAAKILPFLVLPALVVADRSLVRDRRSLLRVALGAALALAVGFGPLLLSRVALSSMMSFHLARGLNVESTLGVLFGVLRALAGHREAAPASFGSQNFDGGWPDALAKLTLPLMLLALLWLAFRVHRRPPAAEGARVERLGLAALASVAVLWLTSKVLSPQYLTWCIPLVLAIPGAVGRRLTWIAILAMIVTQLYFRGFYDLVVEQAPVALVVLVVRQALLFVLLGISLRALLGRDARVKAAGSVEAARP